MRYAFLWYYVNIISFEPSDFTRNKFSHILWCYCDASMNHTWFHPNPATSKEMGLYSSCCFCDTSMFYSWFREPCVVSSELCNFKRNGFTPFMLLLWNQHAPFVISMEQIFFFEMGIFKHVKLLWCLHGLRMALTGLLWGTKHLNHTEEACYL